MFYVFIGLVPSIIITVVARLLWSKKITFGEFLTSSFVNIIVALFTLSFVVGYNTLMLRDVEILNGHIYDKQKVKVSCEHSYQVCTTSGSGANQVTTCVTHYHHSHDFDWVVKTTIGDTKIKRINSQGTKTPPRWENVIVGEPASFENTYTNYLLADENSLFRESKHLTSLYALPKYPEVYDYYRIIRTIPFDKDINNYLNERLKTLGVNKEVNIVVITTKEDANYFNALMAAWNGGKKNDVVMVFGLSEDNNVKWFRANTYARGMNNLGLIHTMESIATDAVYNVELIGKLTDQIAKDYVRLPVSEFEFKKKSMKAPLWLIMIIVIFNAVVSVLLSYYMYEEDSGAFKRFQYLS